MEVMGYLGNFYVILLFLFLLGGAGIVSFNFSRRVWDSTEKFVDQKGGRFMGNKWIKLAVTSFVGILIASFALGLTNSFAGQDAGSAHNHGSQAGGQMNMSTDQMGGMSGMNGMNTTNGMNGSDAMSGMNNMNGMGVMNGQMGNVQGYGYDVRLYQLQMNMMQLQQQMNQLMQSNMNQQMNPGMGNMNNSSNMSSMGGSSQMNSGGGMSMM